MQRSNNISILTFNFNDYDRNHSHYLSNNFNFISLSDDIQIKDISDPWKKSLYVRYHPFEFVNTDIAIVIDGSLIITKDIELLIKEFENSTYDIGVVLSNYMFLKDRIARWKINNRITVQEETYLYDFLKKYNCYNYEGCIASAARIYKKTKLIESYLDRTWNELTKNNMTIRLDEVVSTVILDKEFPTINCMVFDNNLINGDVFQYTNHKTGKLKKIVKTYSIPKFKNEPITPVFIGEAYNRKYQYKSEAMCLTRYFTEQELRFWLDYHVNIGFDHIHIFDNMSNYNCKEICKEYGDKVSYEFIEGNARHYKIFDDYVNSDRCKSEWIIPIDDDEYFELNKNICTNINECIDWYQNKFPREQMFAIRWKHLFPKVFHSEPTGNILEYCTEENPELAKTFQRIGDRGVKTIVHRYGHIHYEETEENPAGGHVPKHSNANGAKFYNGQLINKCSCNVIPKEPNEPARLIHCRYKGYTWYKNKLNDINTRKVTLDNTSGKVYISSYKFDEILETLE